ncbi:nuclear transport factor 2 family protein [Chitinophaga horti]|uniref:Nuclear transport factor 2 family protein n=1 Tax=Chitinophaga horti TaxID=2920382 RepID=A0ABY6J7D9_9BACT|nr:nuclear transport factor 2 family protein [Chitinophaga horti]UYQ95603.1 nuclear transport factor 2 family protein [Chitinophaga horti]
MNLPKVIADLVQAQADFDAAAYAANFSETAVVYDEGKTHKGRREIQQWIAAANEEYKAVMKPINYQNEILSAEISGTFPGSPIVLQYHFELEDGFISSLKITG